MHAFMRNINTIEDSACFLSNILNISTNIGGFDQLAQKLLSAEQSFRSNFFKSTLVDKESRDPSYRDDKSRLLLNETIFNELTSLTFINNDEEICLGIGGLLPRKNLACNKQAIYIIGLPSSGKSTLAKYYSDIYSAVILDCDYAKRKLPEYKLTFGAGITHKESRRIVWGDSSHDNKSIFNHFINIGANIILTKIGNEKRDIIENTKLLFNAGYQINLILCKISRQTSTVRSFDRFLETGRYISLPMIFDWYADAPTAVFYEIAMRNKYFSQLNIINRE